MNTYANLGGMGGGGEERGMKPAFQEVSGEKEKI